MAALRGPALSSAHPRPSTDWSVHSGPGFAREGSTPLPHHTACTAPHHTCERISSALQPAPQQVTSEKSFRLRAVPVKSSCGRQRECREEDLERTPG